MKITKYLNCLKSLGFMSGIPNLLITHSFHVKSISEVFAIFIIQRIIRLISLNFNMQL
jgi:hypothetical protein